MYCKFINEINSDSPEVITTAKPALLFSPAVLKHFNNH